jgi:hypothetical protein
MPVVKVRPAAVAGDRAYCGWGTPPKAGQAYHRPVYPHIGTRGLSKLHYEADGADEARADEARADEARVAADPAWPRQTDHRQSRGTRVGGQVSLFSPPRSMIWWLPGAFRWHRPACHSPACI